MAKTLPAFPNYTDLEFLGWRSVHGTVVERLQSQRRDAGSLLSFAVPYLLDTANFLECLHLADSAGLPYWNEVQYSQNRLKKKKLYRSSGVILVGRVMSLE